MHRTTAAIAALALAGTVARADWTYSVITPSAYSSAQALGFSHAGLPAFGGLGPIGSPHAGLWTSLDPASAIDLNPTGASSSAINASTGAQHVGTATIGGAQNAAIWTGNSPGAYSPLIPSGYDFSYALDTDGAHQVGYGRTSAGQDRALMWSGTAASISILNPPNSVGAAAFAQAAGRQVGYARFAPTYTEDFAGFWSGTAASWTFLGAPAGFGDSSLTAISPDGQTQYGWAVGSTGVNWAALWRGTPESFQSLHPSGYLGSSILRADAAFQVGWAIPGLGTGMRAALWQGTAASFFNLSSVLPSTYSTSEAAGLYSTATDLWVAGEAYMPATNTWDAIIWHNSVPAPASLVVTTLGFLGIARRRR